MIRLFAEHRVAANLTMIIMLLAGYWAIKNIPSQLDPPTNFPVVIIDVQWRGASAEDIEQLLTTPIEQQLANLNNLDEIWSRSNNGSLTIWVQFNFDTEMTFALDEVKQRVDNIRNLPVDIEPPRIRRSIDLEPIARVVVTGPGDVSELVPIVRDMEADLLSRGIEGVRYDGLPAEEIAILVSGQQLQSLNMTLDDLAGEINRVSQNVPAGTVGKGQGSRQLRSLDQRRDPLAFEKLIIQSNNQLIRLGDIADVVRRVQDGQPSVSKHGQPAIEMTLWRSTAADAYRAEQTLQKWLAEVRPTLPPGFELTVVDNVWRLLGAQLDMIGKNAVSGLLLVVVTLFLFLSGRVGFWVMVGIPVSFALGLAIFYGFYGGGISIIALVGFIMALGIVVDDAIVVGEDATTHFENGASPTEAAVAGARRMFVPVVTSSLTTLAAFIPLLIMGGVMGDIILTLPMVLLAVIIASLVECFLVLPGHLKASFEKMRQKPEEGIQHKFDLWFKNFRDNKFAPLLRKALDYPGATVCAAVASLVIAISLLSSQHVAFNMVMGFNLETVEAQIAFSGSATDADKEIFLSQLERTLQETNAESEIVNVIGWTAKRNMAVFNNDRQFGDQYASIGANYAFEEDRSVAPKDFVTSWREKIAQPAFVEQLIISVEGGENNGNPDITMVLRGDNLEDIKNGSQQLIAALVTYPGVTNVVDNLPYGREQIIFELTPNGRALGLTGNDMGRQLRAAYSGNRVQIFNQNDTELEVRVVLPDSERDDLAKLQQFPIRTPSGEFVPLSNVAVLYNRRGIDTIRHNNSQMAVRVSAEVDSEKNNALNIIEDIEDNVIDGILEANNLSFGLGGKSHQDQILLETLQLGGLLTLLLIYLILAWVFASYLWPLAIMLSIPFGFSGAVFGHWITGWDVGAMSILAFISLTGIVVNDSIVLISFLKRDLEAGKPLREAIEGAVIARFRAVILTSMTTVAGLSPLMFETSSLSMIMVPIAITICFGLTLATGLVLMVIPAFILLLEGLKAQLTNALSRITLQSILSDKKG